MGKLSDSFIWYYDEMSTTTKVIIGSTSLLLLIRWVSSKKTNLPPGPSPLPILGNLLSMRKQAMENVITRWRRKYGSIFTFYLGPKRVVAITDVDLTHEALVKLGSAFSGRPSLYSLSIISNGSTDIVNAPYGGLWKFQTRVAQQALRQYLSGNLLEKRAHEITENVIQNMERENGSIDFHMHMSLCVCNILHGICFGNIFEFDDPVFRKMVHNFDTLRDNFTGGFLEDFLPPLRLWPTKKFLETMDCSNWVHNHIFKRMDDRRSHFNKDDLSCLADNIIQVEQLIQAEGQEEGQRFTKSNTAQILNNVFGAGMDTTRVTLDWIFLVLVKHPDVQARIHDEIDKVVGAKIPGREHRPKLAYTEATIFETLRLYPVAPFSLLHETMCDTNIGGYQIPQKTAVMFSLVNVLRDPQHWEDPLSFKPERFLDETQTKLEMRNKSFIPFSLGHRSCPGESLAKMEILYIVVGLLQKYTFSLAPGEKVVLETLIHGFTNQTPQFKVVIKSR